LPEGGEINFALDLVGFDDGEIAGPDPDRFAAKLQDQKRAAQYLARQVRLAKDEDRDPGPVLRALIELPRRREDHFLQVMQFFARYLLVGDFTSSQQRLSNIEKMLAAPRFFRKDGK